MTILSGLLLPSEVSMPAKSLVTLPIRVLDTFSLTFNDVDDRALSLGSRTTVTGLFRETGHGR